MSFSISSIKSKSEIEKALSLVARIFSTHTSISETNFRKNKKLEWSGFDFFKDDDIIVAKDSDIIIGVIRLVYRIVHIKGQPYKTAGFADVCISEEYREKGISKKLMKYAINKANFNCDIGLLFARKHVDYYYNKFGFWGLSTYNKGIIRNTLYNDTTASFKNVKSNDLRYCNYFYEKSYLFLSGFMERTPKYWKYILEKCYQLNFNFNVIFKNNELCGYFIYKKNIIYEIAFSSLINIKDILASFELDADIQIEADPEHVVFTQLQLFDFTIHHRHCIFGGHMLKILKKQDHLNFQDTHDFLKINNTTLNFNTLNQF